jgi:hypothetical protein
MLMTIFALFLIGAKWMMRVAAATVIAVSAIVSQVSEAFAAGFAGAYNPANWTLLNTGGTTNGAIDTSSVPNSITLIGGYSGGYSGYGTTNYTIAVGASGTWSFDWNYSSADISNYDGAKFLLNGSTTFLANNASQGGSSVSIPVNLGDTIGFQIYSADNGYGPGVLTVSNFLAPDVEVPFEFSPGLGLLLLGGGWGAVNLRQFVKRRSFVNLQDRSERDEDEDKAA